MSQVSSKKTILTIIGAGLIAEILFELYAWVISPKLFGETLEPANLVMGLFKKYLGLELAYTQAFVIHFLIGSILFAVAVYIVGKLLGGKYVIGGIVTGLALWFVAQGILAPLMGRAFMMDFGPYTQSSFFGHVGMTLIIGLIFARVWKQSGTDNQS
ncbi:hypothetical protein OAS19_00275 [Altererythrobacter sp.]|nr:hypothetical protein [Altererythrobacter sp.]